VPGPSFKQILREVEDHHLDGTLKTRDDALRYVREYYGSAHAEQTGPKA
jgi:hypothetical protein